MQFLEMHLNSTPVLYKHRVDLECSYNLLVVNNSMNKLDNILYLAENLALEELTGLEESF